MNDRPGSEDSYVSKKGESESGNVRNVVYCREECQVFVKRYLGRLQVQVHDRKNRQKIAGKYRPCARLIDRTQVL